MLLLKSYEFYCIIYMIGFSSVRDKNFYTVIVCFLISLVKTCIFVN